MELRARRAEEWILVRDKLMRTAGREGPGEKAKKQRQSRVRDTLCTFRKLRRVPSPLPPTPKLSLHKSEGEEKDHSQGA